MNEYKCVPLDENVEEMFIGPFGSSLKNECFVDEDEAYCMVYEQKHAIQKTMDVETRYVNEQKYNELKRFNIHGGDIIVSCRGTIGETFVVPEDAPLGIMHPSIMKIRLKDGVYDKYYFNLLLKSRLKKHEAEANGSGIKMAISATELGRELFPVPTMQEQQEITDIISGISAVIEKRKQELSALDDLIKARFVEMFGNPVINEKRWRQKSLGEITTKIGSGATPKGGKGAYQEEGITLIRSMNVHNGLFEYRELAHISDEQAAKLDNVAIEENDVLLNITGASVARSCVVPNKILPARVNQHVCIIRCKEYINPVFLNKLLIDDNYQDLLWSVAGAGATREAITKQQVESLQIIMPPVELQNEFMRFCNQVDKSKVAVQKALDETQLLFDSLMQQYFG